MSRPDAARRPPELRPAGVPISSAAARWYLLSHLLGDDGSVVGSSDPPPGQHAEREEIVQFGVPRRPRYSWLPRLLLASLIVAALVFVLSHPGRRPGKHPSPPALPSVSISRVGHRILGISASWDLFGLSPNALVSIQFARGQITRTVLPATLGYGALSLVVRAHDAIIRPLDNVRGYLVRDGRPSRSLTGILSRGGQLLPGPNPGEVWFIGDSQQITLIGPTGNATGISFAAFTWPNPPPSATSDGRGYVLLFNDLGRLYDATPAGLRPVGVLLVAVGPTNWLGLSCQHSQCHDVVVNAATGDRRTLPGAPLDVVTWPWPAELGVVSPDGSVAAVSVASRPQGEALDLVNLHTGRTTTVPVLIGTSNSQTLAWSPDSQWLFALAGDGELLAVRMSDGTVHSLGIRLPAFSQIAMRRAAG